MESNLKSLKKVTEQQLTTESTGVPAVLTVAGALDLSRIKLELQATTRDEVLHELVALVIEPRRKRMAETFFKALKAREEMCSTCVDEGVAIPHSRNAIVGMVDQPVIAYGRHVAGIEYGALDGKPVHHFFLLCAPNVRNHLQLLSRLARLLKRPGFRDKLMLAKMPEEMLQLVRDGEATLG